MQAGWVAAPQGGASRWPHGAHDRVLVMSTRWSGRGGHGPKISGGAGPYSLTVGVPTAAARCPAPLSTVTTTAQRAYSAAETDNDWPAATATGCATRAPMACTSG